MRIILAALASLFSTPILADTCTGQIPCELGDRSYHVREPAEWDGKTPLPVMLHFHGWARQGTLIVKHTRISGATAPRGVLLLAPNGLHKTWDFWTPDSRDTDFAAAVIEDAAQRYPIDRDRIYVSGYSYGSAMAWRFACESPIKIRALLAVSGTLDAYETCETAPQEVRHVHGLKDNVLDFPFGPNGETDYPVKLWRDTLNCGPEVLTEAYETTPKDAFNRTTWTTCDTDATVTLDVHPRGHFIPKGWFAKQLDDLLKAEN